MARRDGHRVLIFGDFNAAPPKGCWGYAIGSATVREDGTIENWVSDTNLTEVFQGGKQQPSWKSSEGPQTAALDRVFVSHLESGSSPDNNVCEVAYITDSV